MFFIVRVGIFGPQGPIEIFKISANICSRSESVLDFSKFSGRGQVQSEPFGPGPIGFGP